MFDEIMKKFQNEDNIRITGAKAAAILGLQPQTLAAWRWRTSKGLDAPDLPWIKVGSRSIRYRLTDVNAYIEANNQGSVNSPEGDSI